MRSMWGSGLFDTQKSMFLRLLRLKSLRGRLEMTLSILKDNEPLYVKKRPRDKFRPA